MKNSISVVFQAGFKWDSSFHDNIWKTEAWYFWGNMKDLFELMHTRWTSEVVDITWRLTKMIAHDIIISIFRLLKYDRIFDKNLDNDTW